MGDISLGCWTDNQQATVLGAGNSPADGTGQPQGCHMVPDEAPQLSTAHSCGPMDLTNYFATLPNEVVAFKDLVAPSPVSCAVKKACCLLLVCHGLLELALQVLACGGTCVA